MNKLNLKFILLVFMIGTVASCGITNSSYTLYRDSPSDKGMRIHVATFDADESESYNRENCDIAKTLFQNQPGVTARYWCEKGRYR